MVEFGHTRRQASFILNIDKGMEPRAAAIAAGYRPSSAARSVRRLLLRQDVSAVLVQAAQRRAGILADVGKAREFAIACGDADALVRCVQMRCKILGLL